VDAAWPHIAALVASGETDKPLLLGSDRGRREHPSARGRRDPRR